MYAYRLYAMCTRALSFVARAAMRILPMTAQGVFNKENNRHAVATAHKTQGLCRRINAVLGYLGSRCEFSSESREERAAALPRSQQEDAVETLGWQSGAFLLYRSLA